MSNIQSINAITQVQPGQQAEAQSPLAAYSQGDVFGAEVVEVSGGTATIRLPQGAVINASQKAFEPLQPGDRLMLQMGQGNSLQLVSVNGQPLKDAVPVSEYSLMRMQVPPSRTNMILADALRQMGAALRPEAFARFSELSVKYPQLGPEQSLLYAASSLPIDGQAVAAFEQWLQSPAQVSDFAVLIEAAAQDPQAAQLLEAAVGHLAPGQEQALAQPQQAAPQQPAQAAQPLQEQVLQAVAQQAAPQQPAQAAQPLPLPAGLSPQLAAQLESSGAWQQLTAELPSLPPEQAQGQILNFMTELPTTATAADKALLYSTLTAPQQPTGQSAQGAVPALKDALAGLFAALENLPADGAPGQALQEAAAGLEHRIRAFTRALGEQQGSGTLKPVAEMGQALSAQIQIGGELGNLLYMQLPVTINNNRQDASLYVLKRNRGANVDEANVTVALCLDTQNMGTVESLLRVERSELSLQFRVESPAVRSYVQSRLGELSSLPFPPQYRFASAAVVLRDTPITPLNAGQTMQNAFGLSPRGELDITI